MYPALRPLAAICLAILAGCATQEAAAPPPEPPQQSSGEPEPAVVAQTEESVLVVRSVNTRTRMVVLRNPDGTTRSVRAGPEVRNLAQIRPGDRVDVLVTRSIAVSMARPEGGTAGRGRVVTRGRNTGRPAGDIADGTRMRVRVERVDLAANRVTFIRPDGSRHTVNVENPRMRAFVRALKPGDRVDVVSIESVHIQVLPPA